MNEPHKYPNMTANATLFEAAKVRRILVQQVLQDPDMTFGFEAEFYLIGATTLMKQVLGQYQHAAGSWMVKPVAHMTWLDCLRYFEPLGRIGRKDNQAVLRQRLIDLFHRTFPEEGRPKPRQQWERLRRHYKAYHLITALRAFPREGFDLDYRTERVIRRLVRQGDLYRMSAYKELEGENFRTFERGTDDAYAFNPTTDRIALDRFYEKIADGLADYLGEPVVVIESKARTRSDTANYSSWGLIGDDRLNENMPEDRVGIELISPVRRLGAGLNALHKVFDGLNHFSRIVPGLTVETTPRTGFHINLGVRNAEIDYVKLLFLMGDEYVARNYDRLQFRSDNPEMGRVYAAQTYLEMVRAAARSRRELLRILQRLRRSIRLAPVDMEEVIRLFRSHIPHDKFFRVNLTKLDQGFIEFRSAGNSNYHRDVEKIARTVRHLAVMLYVATEPAVYRKEFLTKLYKTAVDVGKERLRQHEQTDRPILPGLLRGRIIRADLHG